MNYILTPINIAFFNAFCFIKTESGILLKNLVYFVLGGFLFSAGENGEHKHLLKNAKIKKTFFVFRIIVIAAFVIVLLIKIFIISFPVKYREEIEKYSEMYNVDKALVFAIINTESRFDEKSVSNKGASGLMQIMEPTADWAAQQMGLKGYSYDKIFEPELNIQIGCWILSRLNERYDEDIVLVCAAYNAGMGNVSKWLSDEMYSGDGKTLSEIPFKETKSYVAKVAVSYEVYKIILQ